MISIVDLLMRSYIVPDKLQESIEEQWGDLLDAGDIEQLIQRATDYLPRKGTTREQGITRINYFRTNAELMRYGAFRAKGFSVGSGVIEAGCKTVIGARLKASGMFWSEKGANAIIALRCCVCSRRFEQFWEDRALKTH